MNGTAMGTPPAPPYATIYYGLHESKFLPQYQNHVVFYKHFIGDSLEVWLPHPNQKINSQLWEEFTASMNNYPGLTWEFNTPTNKVDFMDLTISITNGNISTSLFEKPLNLHLYTALCPPTRTPPRYCPQYPLPDFFPVLGSQRSDPAHQYFFQRLQARGYKSDHIKPLFNKAIACAQCYSGPTDRATNDQTSVILHLPFHPNDPPSHKIQQAWRDTIAFVCVCLVCVFVFSVCVCLVCV